MSFQPLREMAEKWPHDFMAATDDKPHSGHLADREDDQSEWICTPDSRCRRCLIDAFCDAAEAEIDAAVAAGNAKWDAGGCHEIGCQCWTVYIQAEVRRVLIGSREK